MFWVAPQRTWVRHGGGPRGRALRVRRARASPHPRGALKTSLSNTREQTRPKMAHHMVAAEDGRNDTGDSTGPSWRSSGSVSVSLRPGAVTQVDHAIAETAFVQQFEPHANIVGEGWLASSHHDGRDEQVALVDQPGPERLGGEVGTAHADVTLRRCLHPPYRIGFEGPLDPGPRAGYRLQRLGVHDLLGRPPYLREVLLDWMVRNGVGGLPVDHRLVHPAAEEVGADRPGEVVDEGVRVLGRLGPVEVAVLVRYVAVERHDRRGYQLGHGDPSFARPDCMVLRL